MAGGRGEAGWQAGTCLNIAVERFSYFSNCKAHVSISPCQDQQKWFMVHLSKKAMLNQNIPIERKCGFCCHLWEHDFSLKQCVLSKLRSASLFPSLPPQRRKRGRSSQNSSLLSLASMRVGVALMQQNMWTPLKWLFDNSRHTLPTADNWCHLPLQYFTKHLLVESASNSSFKIRHG